HLVKTLLLIKLVRLIVPDTEMCSHLNVLQTFTENATNFNLKPSDVALFAASNIEKDMKLSSLETFTLVLYNCDRSNRKMVNFQRVLCPEPCLPNIHHCLYEFNLASVYSIHKNTVQLYNIESGVFKLFGEVARY